MLDFREPRPQKLDSRDLLGLSLARWNALGRNALRQDLWRGREAASEGGRLHVDGHDTARRDIERVTPGEEQTPQLRR